MLSYFDMFPEKYSTELRTVTFRNDGDSSIPAGTYPFLEYYCQDLSCDCQRLLVKVLSDVGSRAEEVATISYSWNEDADASWNDIIGETPNPFLDPFHRQAPYANDIMEFWCDMLRLDPEYAERLKRHYAELRQVYGERDPLAASEKPSATFMETVVEKKRRRRTLHQKQKKSRGRRRLK